MRTLHLSGVVLVAVAVLWGTGDVAVAQDEAASVLPATRVTGTIVDTFYDDSSAQVEFAPGDVHHVTGATYIETNEWSDPRLPTEKKMVLDFTTYPFEGDRLMVTRTSIRLDDSDGSWVGSGVGLSYPSGSQGQDVLVGEGAYAGLFAVLNCGSEAGCEGFIFEGEMPPVPEPVPPAE